jgi:hypothetical protein
MILNIYNNTTYINDLMLQIKGNISSKIDDSNESNFILDIYKIFKVKQKFGKINKLVLADGGDILASKMPQTFMVDFNIIPSANQLSDLKHTFESYDLISKKSKWIMDSIESDNLHVNFTHLTEIKESEGFSLS